MVATILGTIADLISFALFLYGCLIYLLDTFNPKIMVRLGKHFLDTFNPKTMVRLGKHFKRKERGMLIESVYVLSASLFVILGIFGMIYYGKNKYGGDIIIFILIVGYSWFCLKSAKNWLKKGKIDEYAEGGEFLGVDGWEKCSRNEKSLYNRISYWVNVILFFIIGIGGMLFIIIYLLNSLGIISFLF